MVSIRIIGLFVTCVILDIIPSELLVKLVHLHAQILALQLLFALLKVVHRNTTIRMAHALLVLAIVRCVSAQCSVKLV